MERIAATVRILWLGLILFFVFKHFPLHVAAEDTGPSPVSLGSAYLVGKISPGDIMVSTESGNQALLISLKNRQILYPDGGVLSF